MNKVYVLLVDTIKQKQLQNYSKNLDASSFIEVDYDEQKKKYEINPAGIIVNHSYIEAQERYGIKYGYIINGDNKLVNELIDYCYTFLKTGDNNYDLIGEPIKLFEKTNSNQRIFNALYYNSVNEKLPFDLYTISEKSNNNYEINALLIYKPKLDSYEINNPGSFLVYKIDNLNLLNLYKNQIKTFVKDSDSKYYKSVDLELTKPDKIYKKTK